MDQCQRMVKLRFSWFRHYKEKTQNVAKTCRYFGISRPTFYYWRKRYQEKGIRGLCERSRRPRTSPRATNPDTIIRIRRLRKKYGFGAVKISRYLIEKYNFKISPKTVYTIYKKQISQVKPAKISSLREKGSTNPVNTG